MPRRNFDVQDDLGSMLGDGDCRGVDYGQLIEGIDDQELVWRNDEVY
jgi:hypothetical protein